MRVYKFLLRWIQRSWIEDGYQVLVTQFLCGFLDFGQGGRQWCHIWVLRSTKVLSRYLLSGSICEFNCVLQHSILIQHTIYDLDDCIMSLILIDQVLTILYQALYECVFLSCCGPANGWLAISLQILISAATGGVDGVINLPAKLFSEPCKESSSFIDCWFWDIWGRMVYSPGKLLVLPVEMGVIHLGIYSCAFFIVKLLGQFGNAHYVDQGLGKI